MSGEPAVRRLGYNGHTGFKGSWLCVMLQMAGAKVVGYALSAVGEFAFRPYTWYNPDK